MSRLVTIFGLVVAITTMMTSNQPSIYASSTSEDDGYTYPDDASEEEKEEIDEREQEAWEDAGRPGERDDDDDDDGDGNDNDSNDNDNTPVIANTPALTVQNTAVNETRWYNNCVGGGKQDGEGLHFNTFSYQTCGHNANGDKAYYDGKIWLLIAEYYSLTEIVRADSYSVTISNINSTYSERQTDECQRSIIGVQYRFCRGD